MASHLRRRDHVGHAVSFVHRTERSRFWFLSDDHNQLDYRRFEARPRLRDFGLRSAIGLRQLLVARDTFGRRHRNVRRIGYESTAGRSRSRAVCLSVLVDGETRTRSFPAPSVEPDQTITRDLWRDRDFETFGPGAGLGRAGRTSRATMAETNTPGDTGGTRCESSRFDEKSHRVSTVAFRITQR